ncbi:hypothetical protein GCM10017674_33220 [Streptomyces gardneri]|nr:hypothetical protein GCM10017674_33220 [Streptomyces gardneri]
MSGALILDSEGLAKAIRRDREVHEWLTAARDTDLPVITSAASLVEVIHPRINDAALKWTLSRLRIEPVTQALAQSAAGLLRATGLHGHKYAMLCATALTPHHHPDLRRRGRHQAHRGLPSRDRRKGLIRTGRFRRLHHFLVGTTSSPARDLRVACLSIDCRAAPPACTRPISRGAGPLAPFSAREGNGLRTRWPGWRPLPGWHRAGHEGARGIRVVVLSSWPLSAWQRAGAVHWSRGSPGGWGP